MSPAPRKKKDDETTAAEVEQQASEEAGKSVPKADDAPAPAEESSEAAAVEASSEEASAAEGGRGDERSEAGPKAPAKKPRSRAKKADTEEPKAAAEDDASAEDKPAAEAEAKPKRGRKAAAKKADEAKEEKPKKAPSRKRDQPRAKRQPGEAAVVVRAQARYVRTSARKARLVCDHIRGKDVEQARAILSFTPRGAAKPWLKLLESAIANAEHNHELVGDELRIHSIHADEGPTLKRYRPRAMGRATRIRKRTSHLTITLTPKE
jgi:ribosomal protein L22